MDKTLKSVLKEVIRNPENTVSFTQTEVKGIPYFTYHVHHNNRHIFSIYNKPIKHYEVSSKLILRVGKYTITSTKDDWSNYIEIYQLCGERVYQEKEKNIVSMIALLKSFTRQK